MAEYTAVPTTSWASLVAGAVEIDLQNQGSCPVKWATHTTTPTGGGVTLRSGATVNIKCPSGSNIYVKANDPSSDARVVGNNRA